MPDKINPGKIDYDIDEGDYYRPDKKIKELHQELRDLRKEQRRRKQNEPRPNRSVFWGLLLILVAVLIILTQWHWLSSGDWWKAFLIGLGFIYIIESVIDFADVKTRSHGLRRLIPGFIFLFVGFGFLINFNNAWPVALIAAGVAILFTSWFLQREIQKRKVTQESLHES